jgi:TonB family protein
MSRDRDDEENLLTPKMRVAFIVHELRPNFAQRVTDAWLKERSSSTPTRRWPGFPGVVAMLTLAVGATLLLWLGVAARSIATQPGTSTRAGAPVREPKEAAKAVLVDNTTKNTQDPDPMPPAVPPAAAQAGRPYQPVSDENIKKMPDVDSDACGRSIEYPAKAMNLGIEGDVILRVELDDTGRVHGVRVVSGLGHGLDEAAVFAVTHKCKFTPAISKDGHPVAYVIPKYVFHFETPTASAPSGPRAAFAKAPPGQGRACSAKNKCDAGLQCVAKGGGKSTCEVMCSPDGDCPEDQRCVADRNGQVCRPIVDLNL